PKRNSPRWRRFEPSRNRSKLLCWRFLLQAQSLRRLDCCSIFITRVGARVALAAEWLKRFSEDEDIQRAYYATRNSGTVTIFQGIGTGTRCRQVASLLVEYSAAPGRQGS